MSAPYGLILAGGRGTRFWPRSRKASAKQVLTFFGERSLIQQTVDRLGPVIAPERIWILTNDHLRATIVKQLPEVPARQILAEPAQRNTAPAIGLAAHILESINPGAVMGVFPADHVIGDAKAYRRLLRPAIKSAREGNIVVLGIKPRWAETGYGYIEFPPGGFARNNDAGSLEPLPVKRFREKPDAATAARFVRKGNFYWNAGMFFWRASVLLDALRKFLPNTAALLDGLPAFGSRGFEKRVAEVFPQCENISVDYAVLEKSPKVVGFAAGEFGWNDVGSWNAVYELARRDADSNVLLGDTLVAESTGNYSHVPGKLVALLGVKDLIVVDTPGALLIADRHRAQQVGDLVKRLEKAGRGELL
jgi:mannose-1-phosphate guanylyltransferase